jgi:hypothetical protein
VQPLLLQMLVVAAVPLFDHFRPATAAAAASPPVFDIMMSIVFWLVLLADDLLKPGRGHSRSWKALEGPQNCSRTTTRGYKGI